MVHGIYIHIPFCRQSCHYCHFITVPYDVDLMQRYKDAVIREISLYAETAPEIHSVDTIYFGGGTPTLLPAEYLDAILDACRNVFDVRNDCEISLETNPETVLRDTFRRYRDIGINRVSMGVQSLNNRELHTIGRMHTSGTISKAMDILTRTGFNNVNFDILLGLPQQTVDTLTHTLRQIPRWKITHISVYMLDLDEPCPLAEEVEKGVTSIPDDDSVAGMYLNTINLLDSYGFGQYEISNFAREGYACRHNLKYWLCLPVIGFGLSSHSYDGRWRYCNIGNMQQYLQSLESGCLPIQWRKELGERQKLEEKMFLGLRLKEGISWAALNEEFQDERLPELENTLRRLCREGFVEWEGGNVRLTASGMLISNEIFQLFL